MDDRGLDTYAVAPVPLQDRLITSLTERLEASEMLTMAEAQCGGLHGIQRQTSLRLWFVIAVPDASVILVPKNELMAL